MAEFGDQEMRAFRDEGPLIAAPEGIEYMQEYFAIYKRLEQLIILCVVKCTNILINTSFTAQKKKKKPL